MLRQTVPESIPDSAKEITKLDNQPSLQAKHRRAVIDAAGPRYADCSFASFEIESDDQRTAVEVCRKYVLDFAVNFREGRNLILIGPTGVGKDHLMISTLFALIEGYPVIAPDRLHARYVDGMTLLREIRESFGNRELSIESQKVKTCLHPSLWAVSDPIPPLGSLSKWEMQTMLTFIDARYRARRPIAATINVASRKELTNRLGPQATDRLLENAIVVRCAWESHRQKRGSSRNG